MTQTPSSAQSPIPELDFMKPYDPRLVEQPIYAWWETSGFFSPRADAPLPPFVISIPPPNVTGELHVGHAMFVSIEDMMIRWRRMQGHAALWVPGTDHAGIATQLQVEKLLQSEGRSRQEVGREEFVRRTWEWTETYGGKINQQIRRMGASCDWNRERFTLDAGLSRAVHTAFKRLYDDGLIYRGTYLVNWSPQLRTAVSDLEVNYETRQASIWTVRYPLINDGGEQTLPAAEWGSGQWASGATDYISVATTRPETILGDTAVAVHPDDMRYQHLIGRSVMLPATGRIVPIIADAYVEQDFGTGAVKITPAHDPNDYEIGKRHNLPMINIMNQDATLNAEAGPYVGMDRFDARTALLADLRREGLLLKEEPYTLNVAVSQRGGEIIERMLSQQWFVRVQPLAEKALAAVVEKRTRIVPENFEKVYIHWLEHIQDWCISRQLWWGHRIPVWYLPDGTIVVPHPDESPPEGAIQDPDVLDTWFSSGLWPFSTLGWPEDTPDMRTFYPTSVMETGYDILFFWVARMMMMGCYLTGTEPFHTIYLHGLVRDEQGRKMSKTYGNVVDPLDVMEQYGTDAFRFTLITSSTPGQDVNLNLQRVEAARNFINKGWNIVRFVVSTLRQYPDALAALPPSSGPKPSLITLADRWIASRCNRLIIDVDRLMEGYHFGEAGRQINDFLWSEFADWYIEIAKIQLEHDEQQRHATCTILFAMLERTLRLLHPFIPFVTEAAWQRLLDAAGAWGEAIRAVNPAVRSGHHPALMLAEYPKSHDLYRDSAAEEMFELVQEIIRGIRNVRNEYKVEAGHMVAATIVAGERAPIIREQAKLIARLARVAADQLEIVSSIAAKPTQTATLVLGPVEVFLPLAGLVDLEAERLRLQRELRATEDEIKRRTAQLANTRFTERAPAAVVQRERDGLALAQETAERLRERLMVLSNGIVDNRA